MSSDNAQTSATAKTPHTRPDLAQLADYVPGKAVPGALKLASNEMTGAPLPSVSKTIAQTLANPASSPNRYPDMGAVVLRTKLATHLDITMDQVAVGCGSSALCLQLVQATCTTGDNVVFPWRSFEAYPILTRIAGAEPVAVPLDAEARNDLTAMAAAINDRTRLVFVCNPNNPTGTTVTEQAFREFMGKVPSEVVVALDEAYIELIDDDTRANTPLADKLISEYPNLVGLRTFSKVYGLAGLRVGYAFGSADLIRAVNKVAIPFSVNTVAQSAAVASLAAASELEVRIKEVQDQRVRFTEAVNKATGTDTVLPDSQSNFVWIDETRVQELGQLLVDASANTTGESDVSADDIKVDSATALGAYLADKGVLVRWFAGEGVRITVTNDEEVTTLLTALGLA